MEDKGSASLNCTVYEGSDGGQIIKVDRYLVKNESDLWRLIASHCKEDKENAN